MKKEVKKVPQLRFPEFTGDWEQRKLGEMVERITRKNQDLVSELPLTISAQYGLIDQNEFFDKRVASKDVSGYYLIKKGEFAYNKSTSTDAPWGAIKRLDRYENGVLSTIYIVFAIKDKDTIDSDFLVSYYSTNLWHKEIHEIAAEGARNHGLLNIAPSDFFQTKLMIPKNIEEQKKIGDYLLSLDNLITLHQRKLEKIKKFKKGVMQKLFSQEVRFKADDGSDFPEWEEKKLGKVADIYDGVHQTPEYVSSGVKFVSVENIESIYSTNKYITQKAFERDYKNNIPKKWDILMTRIGDVGRVALIDDDEQLAYYVSLALIRVSSDFVPQFFVQALRSDFFQAELWRNMLHTAYPKKINKQDIGKCKVKFPVSIAEQQKIADCLSALDEVIEKQKATLAVWEELKKGLLQQMFV